MYAARSAHATPQPSGTVLGARPGRRAGQAARARAAAAGSATPPGRSDGVVAAVRAGRVEQAQQPAVRPLRARPIS